MHRDKTADYSGLLLKNNVSPPEPSCGVLLRVQLTGQHEMTSTHKEGINQKVAYNLSSSSAAAAAAAVAAVVLKCFTIVMMMMIRKREEEEEEEEEEKTSQSPFGKAQGKK